MVGLSNDIPAGSPPFPRREEIAFGPLPGYLGYLLRRAQARVFQHFGETTAGFGISPGEFGLLVLVHENPGITQVRLAGAVGLDKSTLSPALGRLAARGLIDRRPLPGDRRLQALKLTREGEETLEHLRAKVEEHEAAIAEPLTASERAELMRLLRKMTGTTDSQPESRPEPVLRQAFAARR